MSKREYLTDAESRTLTRLVDEFGLDTVAGHTGLSSRVVYHLIHSPDQKVAPEVHEAVTSYLENHV